MKKTNIVQSALTHRELPVAESSEPGLSSADNNAQKPTEQINSWLGAPLSEFYSYEVARAIKKKLRYFANTDVPFPEWYYDTDSDITIKDIVIKDGYSLNVRYTKWKENRNHIYETDLKSFLNEYCTPSAHPLFMDLVYAEYLYDLFYKIRRSSISSMQGFLKRFGVNEVRILKADDFFKAYPKAKAKYCRPERDDAYTVFSISMFSSDEANLFPWMLNKFPEYNDCRPNRLRS